MPPARPRVTLVVMQAQLSADRWGRWLEARPGALALMLASSVFGCVPREDVAPVGNGGTPATGGSGGSSTVVVGSGAAGSLSSGGSAAGSLSTGGSGQNEGGASGTGTALDRPVRCDGFDEAACMNECQQTQVALRIDGGTADMAEDCKQAYANVLACQIASDYWRCDNIPDSTKCYVAGYYSGCGLVDASQIPSHPVAPYWVCSQQLVELEGCLAGWYRPIVPLDAGPDAAKWDAAPEPVLEPLCAEVCRLQLAYHSRDSGM